MGLGKTIEAGIVISQKWAERKKKILIIVPSNLRKQWNQELLDKFFLSSIILEQDKTVLKWLRPASNQFNIYWDNKSKRYTPDFVAETADTIYMIETKKEGDIETMEEQEKSQAALTYCTNATEFTAQNGGKFWEYILIPHNVVKLNMGFDTLTKHYEYRNA